jgi:uncharacterized protein (TIGR02996 family)
MTTEEEFLRVILDDINNASRRLVFADWLEERGDPRADWLRIDCELATVGLKDDRRPALEARKWESGESHRESLIAWERRFALARIKDKVARIPKENARPEPYGRGKHKGLLNLTLSESELAAFETEHRVTLPEEYRTFLREVGNGGLGPGCGLSTLAEAVENSPSRDLDKPFPFSFHQDEEMRARRKEDRANQYPEHWEYAQPGVLWLARPMPDYASVYLVIAGKDRGMMWCYGHECGWVRDALTSDEYDGDAPFRSFFRWYEDWLDEILPKENAGASEWLNKEAEQRGRKSV